MIKTPYLTVDGIIKILSDNDIVEGIVLIERKNPPPGLALPGGFVDMGESCEDALKREMMEETGLDVQIERLLGVYSDPARDPRFHTVSCVYVCHAGERPVAGDDAAGVFVIPADKIEFDRLCFDHARIIRDYLAGS